ncbi:hypothetical protein D3C78_1119060 [compost metagenome]
MAFQGKAANDGNPLNSFMQISLNSSQCSRTILRQLFQALVQYFHSQSIQRKNRDRNKGQQRIQIEHKAKHKHQRERIQPYIHHPDFNYIFGLFRIINKARDHFSHLRVLVIF